MARRRFQRGSLIPFKGMPNDGLWRGRWRKDVIENGAVKRVYCQEIIGTVKDFPTRKLAERRLEEVLRPVNSRSYRATEVITFKDLADKYKTERVPMLNQSEQAAEKSRLNVHLVPYFGAAKVHEITPGDVQTFIALAKVGPKTVKNLINTMRQLHHMAINNNYCPDDVDWFRRVKLPKVVKREMPFFTEDEMRRIVTGATGLHRTFYWILSETGIRLGEGCGLTAGSILLDNNMIVVRQSAWQGKPNPSTKNGKTRIVDISPQLREHLRPIVEGMQPDAYIFATENGTPWNGSDLVKDHLSPLLVSLKIKVSVEAGELVKLPDVGAHAFRHGNISIMVAENTNPKVIAERVGHYNFDRITLPIYTHSQRKDHIEAAEKLGAKFAPVN